MKLNEHLFDEIIREISQGATIKKTLIKYNLSNWNFFEFLKSNAKYQLQYDKALEYKAEIYVDEIIDIADTEENPAKARNRIEARRWKASKILHKRYGERIDINVNNTIDIKQALSDGRARIAEMRAVNEIGGPTLDLNELTKAQVMDITTKIAERTTGNGPVNTTGPSSDNSDRPSENEEDDIFG